MRLLHYLVDLLHSGRCGWRIIVQVIERINHTQLLINSLINFTYRAVILLYNFFIYIPWTFGVIILNPRASVYRQVRYEIVDYSY